MKHLFRITSVLVLTLFLTACGGDKKPAQSDSTSTGTAAAGKPKKVILFFGDSLTAGYGLDDATQAFPGVVQTKIDSAKLPYIIINGGLSGETSAGGRSRIDWLLKQQPFDIFVLELGANDGLRGLPVADTEKNLQAIIDKVKAKYPQAKLVMLGMQVPTNMGAAYSSDFKNIFPELATKNKMTLVPFLLQGVGGVRKLNQADGIHPTEEGAKILGANVWEKLKEIL
ncbi:arylesterase [Mucilaginibacter sp. ZT4R22]|uniref:Arylesterase n=1 Tax=Mucilaginibacter pankratovii TaxID=2772110 RepID=A0ABR7WKI7_9SPHI|nr:arylesterase [Mucilaginibacter pankratovii]MBD1362836.1 arylesterase [Mucilaginibacter pankratovii]